MVMDMNIAQSMDKLNLSLMVLLLLNLLKKLEMLKPLMRLVLILRMPLPSLRRLLQFKRLSWRRLSWRKLR